MNTQLRRCPRCGARVVQLEAGVLKTSAVLIAAGETHAVFPSLREVPEPLRRRVVESTSGRNAGTILIADRRGKEAIERAARIESAPKAAIDFDCDEERRWRRLWPLLAALLVGGVGASLAFLLRW